MKKHEPETPASLNPETKTPHVVRFQQRMASRKSSKSSSLRRIPEGGRSTKLSYSNIPLTLSKRIMKILDGLPFSIFISVVTLYVLIADDIRQCAFPPSADLGFTIVNLVCMGIFLSEMLLLCFFKTGYFLRFYFWLDLISLATMIFDLFWIDNLMSAGNFDKATSVVKMVRAGRASQIGSRSARLVRIIRLIRIMRLYKNASATLAKNQARKINTFNGATENGTLFNGTNGRSILRNRQVEMPQISLPKETVTPLVRSQLPQLPNHNDFMRDGSHDLIVDPMNKTPNKITDVKYPELPSPKEALVMNMHRKKFGDVQQEAHQDEGDRSAIISNHPRTNTRNNNTIPARSVIDEGQQMMQLPNETKVGIKLKDEIQKNIILMVILILISVPMFATGVWVDMESLQANSLDYLKTITKLTSLSANTVDAQLRNYINFGVNNSSPLIYLYYPVNSTCCEFPTNYSGYSVTDISAVRGSSLTVANYENSTAIFNDTARDVLTAQLSLGRTIFVCILLIVASLLFSRDVETYALQPLEEMFGIVKRISKDPIKAIIAMENEAVIKGEIDLEPQVKTEPVVLQNMIVKISSLLVVGFGEAGSEMITKNIENHGALSSGLQGKKVMAIFGFCDIRNFTDATEVLQTNVMNFVNDIAEVVHGTITRYAGSANKNIGDAFLLVWKFGEKETIFSEKDGETQLTLRKISKVRQIADLAVFSFMKVIAETNKSHVLLKYKNNDKLKERIKNYKGVSMGFGMHVGWAIEGGIGSQFKIDASYLGPNVNMAGRLQAATKQFGTPILITGDLADLMNTENKRELRKIDYVGMSGSERPYQLYTVDISIPHLLEKTTIKPKNDKLTVSQKRKYKMAMNKHRLNLMEKLDSSKKITKRLFLSDKDYLLMKKPYTQEFYETWNKAYTSYETGDWETALTHLTQTETMLGGDIVDGPSRSLIEAIKKLGKMPEKGYRDLVEK